MQEQDNAAETSKAIVKERVGVVTKNAMNKTVTVQVQR